MISDDSGPGGWATNLFRDIWRFRERKIVVYIYLSRLAAYFRGLTYFRINN